MSRYRSRDHRYGESYYKHFRNGKLIKPKEDPFMHFQRRKSFFADNPQLDDVAQVDRLAYGTFLRFAKSPTAQNHLNPLLTLPQHHF